MLQPLDHKFSTQGPRLLGLVFLAVTLTVGLSTSALIVRAEGTGGSVWPIDGKCPEPLILTELGDCVGIHNPSKTQLKVAHAKAAVGALLARAEDGEVVPDNKLAAAFDRVYRLSGEAPRQPLASAPPGEPSILSGVVWVTVYEQVNWYYCGPATAETILRYLGPQTSHALDTTDYTYPTFTDNSATNQARLANTFWLHTDQYTGTGWEFMAPALNNWIIGTWYIPAWNPSKATAWSDINIDMAMGYPVAENVRYNSTLSYIPEGFNPSIDYTHWDVIYGNGGFGSSKYIYQGQPYHSPGYHYYPYQFYYWDTHWPAIDIWHGIVW